MQQQEGKQRPTQYVNKGAANKGANFGKWVRSAKERTDNTRYDKIGLGWDYESSKFFLMQIRALTAIKQTLRPSAAGIWAKHMCAVTRARAACMRSAGDICLAGWSSFHSGWADDNEAGFLF
eukprot:6213657-Pleurochrysis_carterae.AAC.1